MIARTFIYGDSWYLHPLGDPSRPYDLIQGYTLSYLEDAILNEVENLEDVHQFVLDHPTPGLTPQRINLYFNYYYNL